MKFLKEKYGEWILYDPSDSIKKLIFYGITNIVIFIWGCNNIRKIIK